MSTARLRVSPQAIWRVTPSHFVGVVPGQAPFMAAGSVAMVWTELWNEPTRDELVLNISQRTGVGAGQIEHDVAPLLDGLLDARLVELV